MNGAEKRGSKVSKPKNRRKNRHILRDREVEERTKVSRVQRWRRVRAGTFPAPVQLGPNSIGWYEDEIEAWLAARPRVSYAPTPEPAAA
jgi:prophage regulatory protein